MMFKKFVFIFFMALSIHSISQTDIQWQKSLGGTGIDIPAVIHQTADSGYIIAGKSLSSDGDVTLHYGFSSNNDFWIVKLSSSGQKMWVKTLGGTLDDYATEIRTVTNKGYIVAGTERSNNDDVSFNHGSSDFWLVQLDSLGALKWEKTFGGTAKEDASSVEPTNDGGYIIAGSTTSNNNGQVSGIHDTTGTMDMWLVKTDSLGNLQWQKCLGGSSDDYANVVRQTHDGGYIIAGSTNSADGDITSNKGLSDFWIVKVDSLGTLQWQKTFGGTDYDLAKSLCVLQDGGFIIAGSSSSTDGDVTNNRGVSRDYWVVRIDSMGTLLWQKSYGGTGEDGANSIECTTNGGFILAGWTWSTNWDISNSMGGEDYWIVKIDSAGTIEWQKNFGGAGEEEATCIQPTFDGGYIASGFSDSFGGDVDFNHGADDFWIIKLNPDVGMQTILSAEGIIVYPNPANDVLNLKLGHQNTFYALGLSDVCGKKVIMQKLTGELNTAINISALENGVYFLTLSGEQNVTMKIIKQ